MLSRRNMRSLGEAENIENLDRKSNDRLYSHFQYIFDSEVFLAFCILLKVVNDIYRYGYLSSGSV